MARTTFWTNESFSKLVDAIKTNRQTNQKLDDYASNFASVANKGKKLPDKLQPSSIGERTIGGWKTSLPIKPIDRLDDRKQALLHNEEQAVREQKKQNIIKTESARWTEMYNKYPKSEEVKRQKEELIAATMAFDPDLKPGDKLYLDSQTNTVTNKPTNMELFKSDGLFVPIFRNAAGELSFPQGMPIVDLSKVKDVKYTPDIQIYLRGQLDQFETNKPQSISKTIVPTGQQLYYDKVFNQIVDYETQTPMYWDSFSGQMTEQENDNPVVATDETLSYLGTNLTSALDAYNNLEKIGQLGVPTDPNKVSITPHVTRDNVLEGSKWWTMDVGAVEQNTVFPDSTTNQPMMLERQNPAFKLSSFLANIPWFSGKTIGDTVGGKVIGAFNFGVNWIMTGGNLPKQYAFGQQSTILNKPILGISPVTAMSYVAASVTLGWNSVMSVFRQVGYTFSGEMTYKENIENSFDNFYKKMGIAKRNAQLDKIEVAYNSGKSYQEILQEATDKNIDLRTQVSNIIEGKAGKLTDMQKVNLLESTEQKVRNQQSYVELLLELQRETIGKSQTQLDYGNKLITSGHTGLGVASVADSFESMYAGLDFNLMRQYVNTPVTQKDKITVPVGQEVFFAGLEDMSDKDISMLEKFVKHNFLDYDLYPQAYSRDQKAYKDMWMGANKLFLYDLAEQSVKSGYTMTPAETLDYLQDVWLPNFFTGGGENPGQGRYLEMEIGLTQQFSDLSFSQMELSNMYLNAAAGFPEGSPERTEFMQLSNNFKEEAFYNYVENVIPHHIQSGMLNPYASWSYGMDKELDKKFKTAVATTSFQLGRLLSEPEITQLSYMYQDPAMELFGEVFLDLNNFIMPAVGGLSKAIGKNVLLPAVKMIPGVTKVLNGLSNAGFVKMITGQSLQTVANKQGQNAADLLLAVMQTRPTTKEDFIKRATELSAFSKKIAGIAETSPAELKTIMDEADQIFRGVKNTQQASTVFQGVGKLLDNALFRGSVPKRVQQEILQLAKTIDPDEWVKMADDAWEKTRSGYGEAFTKKVLKENPGKTMADSVIVNEINHRVEQRMANLFGNERLAENFASNFREYSLKQNMIKLGSKMVMTDTISGAIAKKYGGTSLGSALGTLLDLQNKYMRLWVWATLARRPAWMIFNFTDNLFRYTMSSIFEGSSFIDDMKAGLDMLSREGVPDFIMESGIIPPKKVQATFFSDVFQGTREVEKLALENVNLSANPLSFTTHWLNIYRHNAAGRGLFGKVLAGFQAWPMGIRSLNNAIETGMKTRMYLNFYQRNIAKLNHTAVADILSTLATTVEEKGVSPEMAKMLQDHIQSAWASSGGNAVKLYDLLKFDKADPKMSGYNIYIPESLRKADWFDEGTQMKFIYGVSKSFVEFQQGLAKQGIKELEPKHMDEFFNEMLRVLEAEIQVKVQSLRQNYDMIMQAEIGTGHEQLKAARFSNAIDKEIPGVTPEAADFLLKFDNTKPLDSDARRALKNHLKLNGIEFKNTDESLLSGYDSLMKKMNDHLASKKRPMNDVEVAEVLKEVDPTAPPKSQTELNANDAKINSSRTLVNNVWDERNKLEGQTHNFVEKMLDDVDALKSLSKEEKMAITNNVKGLIYEINNFSSRIASFWQEVFPGPLAGKHGIDYKSAVGNRWDSYDRRMVYQLENRIAHMNSDIIAAINTGTFKPGTDITAEEILRLSGIDLFYGESGEILAVRILNPTTGTVQEIEEAVVLKGFKDRLGIINQADATKPRVTEWLKAEGKPIHDPDYLQSISFKLRVPQMPSLDEMIKLDPRLDLAIREKDWRSANIILAEKFQFKMRSEAGANLDQVLVNKVKKHADLKDVKKLSDIDPKNTYRVLNDWFRNSSGITLKEIQDELKPQFVSALENLFNVPKAHTEDMMRIIEGLGGTIRGGIEGKSPLEAWGEVLVGLYKSDVGGGTDMVRATDSMHLFNSKIRGYVKKQVGNAANPKELLKLLTKEVGLDRVKLLQLDSFLKGKKAVSSADLLKHLDKVERFIVAKATGNNYSWVIDLMDFGSSVKVNMNADLLAKDVDGVTTYGLKVTSQAGELDELSKQRLLYWAGENQYSFIEYTDGTIDNIVARDFLMGEGTYGVTQFVKDEFGKQQAIIRAMTNASTATAIEEFFHAAKPFLPQTMIDELDDWAGKLADDLMKKNPDKGWSKYQWVEEIEAKGFQKTIITKLDAPKNVQEIFDRLRNTLVAIYRKWKDYFEGIVIPKNVEEVYIRMLDKDYVAKQVKDVPKPKKPKPTQGTLFQQATERTSKFNDWFTWDWMTNKPGVLESVAQIDGVPITVYHGMGNEFDAFDLDFMKASSMYGALPYFTESAAEAGGYVARAGGQGRKQGFYLSIQKEWDMDVKMPWDILSEVDDVLKSKGYRGISWQRDMYGKDAYKEWEALIDGQGVADAKQVLNNALKEAGYDGMTFIHGSISGSTPHRVWSVFNVPQAKAVDNVGDWSVTDVRYLFQQADKTTEPLSWANEVVKALDNMFNDPTTTLPTRITEPKRFTVTITPNTFDYVHKTFGLEETKSYVKQISESIVDAAQGTKVAHISPGKFALGFDSQKEIDKFLKVLSDNEKKVVNLFTADETWSVNPKFIVGIGNDTQNSLEELSTALIRNQEDVYQQWMIENAINKPNTIDDLLHTNEAPLFPELYQGAAKKKPPKDVKNEVNEAWKAFVQSPIFDYGNEKISLKDMWTVFFENEDTLYKAGSKGFKSYALKVAQQLEDAGNMEMSEIFRNLADLTDNFVSYLEKNVLRVDPLFPKTITGSPMPLWKMNEAMRNYVSNKYMVGSEWMKSRRALEVWREELKQNLNGSLMAKTEITPEVRETLDTVANYGFNVKNQIDEVANYGGTYKDITIDPKEGAVKKTNFTMMDYSDNSVFLQTMKQVFPFISYPAKSIGYWTDLLSSHPELITFYYKYQKFSDSMAIQNGAVASNGEVLPSLEGYMPIMEGLWFNPLAPLVYRFAFPRLQNLTDSTETEDMTPVQKVSKFLLDDAPIFGFNLGPIPTQILMTQVDPYYPKAPWWYEGIRAYFPIDYIPPIWERFIVQKLRQVGFKSSSFPGDTLMPRVSWQDYLIEKELLSNALLKLDTIDDPKEKLAYAKTIKAILGNPDREKETLWVEARNKMETDQYWRTMSGHMTGLYTKPFTDGQARVQELRDEINILKLSIEDQTLANLFGMSGESGKRYDDYKDFKFETPEGYFYSAIQMSRYVTDPETGQPLIGQARRDRMEEIYNTEEQTSLYFTAIKEAKSRYQEKLLDIPVGDWELRRTIKEEYVKELTAISESPLYLLANKDSFIGYKPEVRIVQDLKDRFWYQILATKPSRNPSEEYEDYERRVQEWEDEIPEFAEISLPLLEMSIINQITESSIRLEERLGQVPVWMTQLKQQANLDGFNQWSNDKATSLDAVWDYFEKQVIQPYIDGLKGKDMYESQAYKMQWENSYREPSKEDVIAWVQKTYGKTKFTAEEIVAELEGKGYIKPEDRLQSGKNDIEKSMDKVWSIRAALGPAPSEDYKNYMEVFYSLGGTDEEWDRFFYAGGDVSLYKDVDEYTEFLRKVELAFLKGGFEPATQPKLLEFSQVKKDQEEFSTLVEGTLGSNIWDLMSDYYSLSTSERKTYRAENQDEYYRISQYYTLKDQYANENPVWASYYHPDFESSTTGGSSSSSGGGGGYSSGGYSNSGSGYSATYQEYKRSPYANAFLPQGKRGARTGMELIVYGLGKGGVTKQPWWPQELLDKLHEQMVAQIQSGQVTQAGLDYLNSVAQSNPEYSKIIRDNVKAIRKLGTANRVEVNMK